MTENLSLSKLLFCKKTTPFQTKASFSFKTNKSFPILFCNSVLNWIYSSNTKRQEKYIFLHRAWILIKSLRHDFFHDFEEIHTMTFSSFEYLGDFAASGWCHFRYNIQTFLLNMDNRFPCRSFHLTWERPKIKRTLHQKQSTTLSWEIFKKDVPYLKW